MQRRHFLAALAGAGSVPFLPAFQARPNALNISDLEFWRMEGHREADVGINGQHQVNPGSIYEEMRRAPYHESPNPGKRTAAASALYLKIRTGQGLEGVYGPIDQEAAIVVDFQLRPMLVGRDPLAIETLWDQMYRSNRHSREGHFMMGISAVDNALWDLRGKYFGVPVYRLLGGPTRRDVEAYGSCLGSSVEPEPLRKRTLALREEGFRYQKWFMAYGPGDGPEGMTKNVEMVRNLREALGEEPEIMFDAYSGWDLNYTLEWAKRVERYRPYWIEEAFQSEKLESFVALRRAISFAVATGEHFYGRWEVERFLHAGALNVVQADPEWCGGVSELVRICTVASAHDVQVIPHGHGLHAALHVIASQSPMTCPLIEVLLLKMQSYYHFEKHSLYPVKGRVALPDRPGFGIEFDSAKVEKQSRVKWAS